MTTLLGVSDYVVVGCMLSVSASVGFFFRFTGGRQKTTKEFLFAGGDMAVGPVAFSLMATFMSAISVLGMPAETYMYGTQFSLWMAGVPVGGLLAAYAFLPVFFEMKVSTVYEYLEERFGKVTRSIASLLFTFQMILYMAVVLYAPSLALNAVTGLSTWASVVSLSVVCTFYCSLGGLKAVLWTDVFQALLMYITISAIVIKGLINMGFNEAHNIASDGGRLVFLNMSFDPTLRYTFWNSILSGIVFSFHSFGTNQAQIQRMLSVGSLKKAQTALIVSIPMIIVFNFFTFWDGVIIYSLFHDCDPMLDENSNLDSPDQLVPLAIFKLFGDTPGLPGLCVAGVFSAALSTISSAVNSLTATTMEDFIKPFGCCTSLSESWMTFVAKLLAVGYGALTLLLTLIVSKFRGVIEAANVVFGMVGGPVLGVFMLGMFFRRPNEPGTLFGLLVGTVVNGWLGFGSFLGKSSVESLHRSTAGCNATHLLNSTIGASTSALLAEDPERYVPYLYRLSFVWFPFIGAITVVIVGYIASFLISFWIKYPDVDPIQISPLLRKLYFKTEATKNGKVGNHVELLSSKS